MLSAIKPHLGTAQVFFVIAAIIYAIAAIVDCTLKKKLSVVAMALVASALMAIGLVYIV